MKPPDPTPIMAQTPKATDLGRGLARRILPSPCSAKGIPEKSTFFDPCPGRCAWESATVFVHFLRKEILINRILPYVKEQGP